VTVTPNFAKVRSISGKCSGDELRTVMSPPVIAPSARNVAISWKSSAKRNRRAELAAARHAQPRGAEPVDRDADHRDELAELLHAARRRVSAWRCRWPPSRTAKLGGRHRCVVEP
jgi:hypothetical protein